MTDEQVFHKKAIFVQLRNPCADRDRVGVIVGTSLGGMPKRTYVCGSNAFVDTASQLLLDMDVPFASIRTERYGGVPAASTGEPVPGV